MRGPLGGGLLGGGLLVISLLEPSNAYGMANVPLVLSGLIQRSGAVTVTVQKNGVDIGTADVSGQYWQFVFAPAPGDVGVQTFRARAAGGGRHALSNALAVTIAADQPFPASVTRLAWLDGARDAMFQDAAGLVPANFGDLVRRANELAPLTHNWQTTVDNLAARVAGGLDLEPAIDVPLSSASNATSIVENDYTIVASWVKRDGDPMLLRVALPGSGTYSTAAIANGDGFFPYPGFSTTIGARHTIGVTFTPTAIKARLLTDHVETASAVLAMAVTGGNPNTASYYLGVFQSFFYELLAQLGVSSHALSDADRDAVMAWADAQPAGVAFPLDRGLFVVDGDSIASGSPGPIPYYLWRYTTLRDIRSTLNAQMLSVAQGGSSTLGHFENAAPFLNSVRPSQIAVFAAGTNDIANGYPASVVLPQYLATLKKYRDAGCRGVAATILNRTGSLSVSQAVFDAESALFNNGLRAAVNQWDALADAAAIPQLGAPFAANNPTYFIDGIHPTQAGQQLMAPVYTAAVLAST